MAKAGRKPLVHRGRVRKVRWPEGKRKCAYLYDSLIKSAILSLLQDSIRRKRRYVRTKEQYGVPHTEIYRAISKVMFKVN